MTKFYDTNALLLLLDEAFSEPFMCSDETLKEIENIKTSAKKDADIKYKARKLARLLDQNLGKYSVINFNGDMEKDLIIKALDIFSPDNRIVSCAAYMYEKNHDIFFISDDLCCKHIARTFFDLPVQSVEIKEDNHTGFKNIELSDIDLAYFYEHINKNMFDLNINQYVSILQNDNPIDCYFWDGEKHKSVSHPNIRSKYFGYIKSKDVYQRMALHSIFNNKITMLKGPAGTGKSLLALSSLFYMLEKNEIDEIIIFCNCLATESAARLGFYPGSKDEKLLDSQIGNILSSKLGSIYEVERLIAENKLILLPMSDIRGYDTSSDNLKTGVYITEAQNTNIDLMKLALQRIGENSICIIDGDYNAQVDLASYSGRNNGMKRMSEVFRGRSIYGEVELQNIYRSEIARIAELM